MSTRDWKIGEVVYLKSGSPAMTVTGTDSHGATKVQWYDPQAVEVERSMYSTATFPKDCLTEAEVPVRMPASDLSAWRVPQLQTYPIRIVAPHSTSTEELTQHILTTLHDLFSRVSRTTEVATSRIAAETQPTEKIVEASVQPVTAQATTPQRQVPGHERQPEQLPRRKNS